MATHREHAEDPDRVEHVISVFESREAARRATVDLERRGIEAGRVRIDALPAHEPTAAERRTGMLRETRPVARHLVIGGTIGAMAGAVFVPLIVLLITADPLTTTLAASIVGGLLAGAAVGAFVTAATSIPVNEEAFAIQTGEGPVALRVHVTNASERDKALAALERHAPERVEVA